MFARLILGIADLLILPFATAGALALKFVRRVGLHRLRLSAAAIETVGILPIRRHYYEPFTERRDLRCGTRHKRDLPGIDWNVREQLALLKELNFAGELTAWSQPRTHALEFRFDNGSFESGDAEFLYQFVRLKKPKVLIEIGSGNSTLVVRQAISANMKAEAGYSCRHICIEPYEFPWLDELGIEIIRRRVEKLDLTIFRELSAGDILFIDSSHVIRPNGDVLTEYLQILPTLPPGVVVHIHDVFSPRDYLDEWIVDRKLLWNEQYLLECMLSAGGGWKVIAALNSLCHDHFEELRRVCPYLSKGREPGSFYIQRCERA